MASGKKRLINKNRPKHEKYLLSSLKEKDFTAKDILSLACMIDINPTIAKGLKKLTRI